MHHRNHPVDIQIQIQNHFSHKEIIYKHNNMMISKPGLVGRPSCRVVGEMFNCTTELSSPAESFLSSSTLGSDRNDWAGDFGDDGRLIYH